MSYTPSETHLELYPDTSLLIKCKCGSRFSPRKYNARGDNPNKCLPCNRKKWSKLFSHYGPIEASVDEPQAHVLSIQKKGRK